MRVCIFMACLSKEGEGKGHLSEILNWMMGFEGFNEIVLHSLITQKDSDKGFRGILKNQNCVLGLIKTSKNRPYLLL